MQYYPLSYASVAVDTPTLILLLVGYIAEVFDLQLVLQVDCTVAEDLFPLKIWKTLSTGVEY